MVHWSASEHTRISKLCRIKGVIESFRARRD